MTTTFLFILILASVGFLLFLWALKNKYASLNSKKTQKNLKKQTQNPTPCPICNSMLYAGETLITRIYKGSDEKEQRATIHGCPYCFPTPRLAVKRLCPVCHKTIPTSGHLDAYLFLRDTGKRHIHITGCTECHKK